MIVKEYDGDFPGCSAKGVGVRLEGLLYVSFML